MKIICSKSNLLNSVNIALRAIQGKTTMSILECLVLNATNGIIKMVSNNMELGIDTMVNGEILEEGDIAVNAKVFSEIIRKLPENDVTIQTNEKQQLSIICEKAKFTIVGKSTEEFPNLPQVEKAQSIQISQFALKEVIRQTVFSIADNESTKIMTGELFEVNGNELKVVSLDGHRISIRKLQLKEKYAPIKVIVPGKTLNEISKILSGEQEDMVQIFFTDNHIMFEFDNTTVLSRLIEGEFYKIEQMLSNDYETKLTINKKEFLSCMDRATLLIKESERKPILINIHDNDMEIGIQSSIGSMMEEIDIEKEGKDILIGFNPRFLMDAIRVIDDEEIDIYLFNPKAPCFIKDKEENYIYLILPVNFNTPNA